MTDPSHTAAPSSAIILVRASLRRPGGTTCIASDTTMANNAD